MAMMSNAIIKSKQRRLKKIAISFHAVIGKSISPSQLYNHLRQTWRTKWLRLCELKKLRATEWDNDRNAITLSGEARKQHMKAHPNDADLLNTPVECYADMEIIFGEALGSPDDHEDPSIFLGELSSTDCSTSVGSKRKTPEPSTTFLDCVPELQESVMSLIDFADEQLVDALDYLMENNNKASMFMALNTSQRAMWVKMHLSKK